MHFSDDEFGTSVIYIKDDTYDFSIDPEKIILVESDAFHGSKDEEVVDHLLKLKSVASLFTKEDLA